MDLSGNCERKRAIFPHCGAQRSNFSNNHPRMIIKTFSNRKTFIQSALSLILSSHPKTIALSGGQTPKPIYKAFFKKPISKIKFYQVDERYVPKNHPDSNFKMITKTLKPKKFYYFDTSLPIKKSLEKYSKELPKKFDLCILGIGPDGHTASLFPNSKSLTSKAKVAHGTTNNFAVKNRLTLTFKSILNSKKILVLLQNKPEVLSELKARTKTIKNFPAFALLKHKNLTIYHAQTNHS